MTGMMQATQYTWDISIAIAELVFGATDLTSVHVEFLSTVSIFRKHQELLSNLPNAKVPNLFHITFDACNLCT